MYFNNISIIYYLIVGLIGLFIGKLTAWANMIYVDEKTPNIVDFWKRKRETFKAQYIIMFFTSACYIFLLYKKGTPNTFLKTLDLIKFFILIPMLISSFLIDLKHRIIPNRLNMFIFEIGIIFTFIYGISNISIAKNMLLGSLTGVGIFLGITLIGGLIAGKEAMGLGDVKFMGAVRIILWYDGNSGSNAFKFFCSSYSFNSCINY